MNGNLQYVNRIATLMALVEEKINQRLIEIAYNDLRKNYCKHPYLFDIHFLKPPSIEIDKIKNLSIQA